MGKAWLGPCLESSEQRRDGLDTSTRPRSVAAAGGVISPLIGERYLDASISFHEKPGSPDRPLTRMIS